MASASPLQSNVIYSDFLSDFSRHPATQDLLKVTNEQSVINSILKIIKTNNYEVPYRPSFGANIYHYLFEPFTRLTISEMEQEIKFAIKKYEPRAAINSINIGGNPDQNRIDITLVVSILNSPNPVTINTTLTRIR